MDVMTAAFPLINGNDAIADRLATERKPDMRQQLCRDRLDPRDLRQLEHRPQARVVEQIPVPGPAFAHTARDTGEVEVKAITDIAWQDRSEEHTSELQSLMRTSDAVF